MYTDKQEESNTQSYAEQAGSENSMMNGKYSVDHIANSPFSIVGNPERGWCLTLGNYRISEFKEYAYDVEKLLVDEQWNIILAVISVINDISKKEVTE